MIPILLLMAFFAVVHSWLAGKSLKQTIRQQVGERAYFGFFRLGYNVLAIVTLAPAFWLILRQPGATIWQVEGVGRYGLLAIQIIGVIGVMISLLQIDTLRFAGIRQVLTYWRGGTLPLPDEPLKTHGIYGLVRHPLYLFSLLAIWPMATMTEALLAFNIGATLYFVLGSLVEERRLLAGFDKDYAQYRKRVPWLIPFLRR